MAKLTKNTLRTSRQHCPECKSTHLVNRSEECTICLDCGFVISPETAERKIATSHKRQRSQLGHCGMAIKENGGICDNLVGVLEQWNQVKIADATERNFALALQYITKTAIDLSVPRVALEKVALVYRRIIEKNLVKGRSMKALAATAVYIGCKQCGVAVTTKRVANVSKISLGKFTRSYRLVAKQINITLQPSGIGVYANDLSSKLQVSQRTTALMEKLVEVLQHLRFLAGKDPTGIACAVLYISSVLNGERKTQREIAAIGGVTEQTLRARCREIERNIFFSLYV